jgi:hypothetical protein
MGGEDCGPHWTAESSRTRLTKYRGPRWEKTVDFVIVARHDLRDRQGQRTISHMSENHEGSGQKPPAEKLAPSSDGLWNQLQNTVTLTAKQDQIVWAIFGVFCAAEAVLLAALFQSGSLPTGFVGPILSSAGVGVSVVWQRIQERAIAWLEFYEGVLIALQNHLGIPAPFKLTVPRDQPEKVKGAGVRLLMAQCPRKSCRIWLAVAIIWWGWEIYQKLSPPAGK